MSCYAMKQNQLLKYFISWFIYLPTTSILDIFISGVKIKLSKLLIYKKFMKNETKKLQHSINQVENSYI